MPGRTPTATAGPGGHQPEVRTTEPAPAKVNLFLAVGPCRADGYHELLTLYESVPLQDEVTVTLRPAPDGRWRFRVSGGGPALPSGWELPRDTENLAGRAALLYAEALTGAAPGRSVVPGRGGRASSRPVGPAHVEVRIEKRIPPAAGLGGGSADAAAVLRALQRLYGHPLDTADLLELATRLGSDVPFLVQGGRAVGRSRGEVVLPRPAAPRLPLVLALSTFRLQTPEVYRELDRLRGRGEAPPPGADDPERGLAALLDALAVADLDQAGPLLRNDLEAACISLCPEVGVLTALLRESGCLGAAVSGSGPTVFGLARDMEEASAAARRAGRDAPPGLAGRVTFVPLLSGLPGERRGAAANPFEPS